MPNRKIAGIITAVAICVIAGLVTVQYRFESDIIASRAMAAGTIVPVKHRINLKPCATENRRREIVASVCMPAPRPPVSKPKALPFRATEAQYHDWEVSVDMYAFDQLCRTHRLGGFLMATGNINLMDHLDCERGSLSQKWVRDD